MTRQELNQLSREELIEQIIALQADNEALRLKLEKGKKPPTNSNNSSQPPSHDHKRNLVADRPKRKHGPPAGHPKHERKLVAQPDHVVNLRPQECSCCRADLSGQSGELTDVNQITELPPAQAKVIEVRQYRVTCPECGQWEMLQPPEGMEMGRTFGARFEATVVYYRQEQHLSYKRTREALWNLHGAKISQGGINQIVQRAGKKIVEEAAAIHETVQQSAVINCDETGARLDGRNWWEWVFCTATAVLHIIKPSRGADVIHEMMGEHVAEVWGSDLWAAQLNAPTKQWQLCLSHQKRNLQAVIDRYPQSFWAQAMQALFRYAIHVYHQRDSLPPEQFRAKVARIERLCDLLLEREPTQTEAIRLRRRYRKHRSSLFVFLYRNDVDPTNNVSERALRASVVHRKVCGSFRSQWGATAYAAWASVIHTAALKKVSAFEAIRSLMGCPALPLPVSL